MVHRLSAALLPFLLMLIVLFAMQKRVDVFEAFLCGAKKGLHSLVSILPALVGLLVAISMFRASGGLFYLSKWLAPFLNIFKIPVEILPLALLRPISGSGALATVGDILATHGPDSLVGRIASVIMGSTETTFYALAVYFGSVKIKQSRHTVPAALLADVTGLLAGTWICYLFFK